MGCGGYERLPGLPMAGVLPAPLAVFAQRDPLGIVALGLIRLVVATLADLAREGHSDTHVSAGHSALRDGKRTEKRPAQAGLRCSLARVAGRARVRRAGATGSGPGAGLRVQARHV